MHKAILGVLAAFLLFGTSALLTRAYIAYQEPAIERVGYINLQREENFAAKYKAWFQACDYTPYSCIGVKVPHVVTEWMRYGLLGYYDGTDIVYVNRRLKGQRLNEVLMHEMIHYLQVQRGGLEVPGYAEPICNAEEEAFFLVDMWLADHSYSDLMRGPEWWRPYYHCYAFYNPAYEEWQDDDGYWWFTVPLGD